jgi:hypothetical protein
VFQSSDCSRPAPARHDTSVKTGRSRLGEHGSYLCLATAAVAAVVLLGLAGCQTPPQTAAPVYGRTVAPPATGMIGQPAPYGTYSASPQAVAYPAAPGTPPTPMPGPATSWQSVAQPAAPTNNTWGWAQSGNAAAPSMIPQQTGQPQSMQQYGNQLANQANQYQQSLANQAQQYGNQLQAQPQQYANQAQQALNSQQQQFNNQMQNTMNQYQQGFNNQAQQLNNQFQQGMQSAQQQVNNQLQQAMPQMPTGPQQQTANGNWWPFSNTSSMPPARAIPVQPARY